jgi:uncharacterized protein (DUF433 family)
MRVGIATDHGGFGLKEEPILAGTATPVRAIAELWNLGMAPEEIPLRLAHLTIQQVFAALYYYVGHRQEIDALIAANRIPEEWSGKRLDPATRQVQGRPHWFACVSTSMKMWTYSWRPCWPPMASTAG